MANSSLPSSQTRSPRMKAWSPSRLPSIAALTIAVCFSLAVACWSWDALFRERDNSERVLQDATHRRSDINKMSLMSLDPWTHRVAIKMSLVNLDPSFCDFSKEHIKGEKAREVEPWSDLNARCAQPPPKLVEEANAKIVPHDPYTFQHQFANRKNNNNMISALMEHASSKEYSHPLILVIIGDSTDRWLALHACETILGVQRIHLQDVYNETQAGNRQPFVCSSETGNTHILYQNIFGMFNTCKNGPGALKSDPNFQATTHERIENNLPLLFDMINATKSKSDEHSKDAPDLIVSFDSHLWDLSNGCNNKIGVDQKYKEMYIDGMASLQEATLNVIAKMSSQSMKENRVRVVWKVSPPISLSYSMQTLNSSYGGRTRSNQLELNDLVRYNAPALEESPGVMIKREYDLWSLVKESVPSEDILNHLLRHDGRHYAEDCSNVAFFDAFLQAACDSSDLKISLSD